MDNIKKIKMISAIVTITGLIVMFGWIFDISILKSILPQWVTMKVLTAVSFILCGIMLYIIARYAAGDVVSVQVIVPIISVIVLVIMGTLITSAVLGINLGIEDYFVKETKLVTFDTKPGMPSLGTMLAFILTAVAGALTVFHPVNLKNRFVYFGAAVAILGVIPIIGYMINAPLLTYFIKGVSTAMAFNTAILFVMIGIAFILLSGTTDKFSEVRYQSGTRISLGYSIAFGIFMIIGAASLLSNAVFTDAVAWSSQSQNIIETLDHIDMILKNAEMAQINFLLTDNENYLKEYDGSLESLKKELVTLRELTRNNPAYQRMLDDLEILAREKIASLDKGISIKKENGLEKAAAFISEDRAAALDGEINKVINDMHNEEQKQSDERLVEITAASKKNTGVVIYGLLASLACFTFFGFLLVRNLSVPLREITNIAERIAQGDLSGSVLSAGASQRQDEVGVLAKSFASMNEYIIAIAKAAERIAAQDMTQAIKPKSDKDTLGTAFAKMQENLRINTQAKDNATAQTLKASEKLKAQVREIKEIVGVLSSTSSQIAASTKEFGGSASQIAASVSETTSTCEEVRQTTALTTDKAGRISKESAENAKLAKQGSESARQAVDGINSIKKQTELVAQSIIKLSEQSQTIGDIISTVNDLAEQSNILAVNAAIEAAKAGEHGKGFTVVAQEVKTLADRSKQATEQVRTILKDIQKATSNAVMSTEKVTKAVEVGVKQFSESGELIDKIAARSAIAADASMQILSGSQQQLVGMKQISQAMESIKRASQQSETGAKQLEKTAEEVNRMAGKLNELTK